MAPKLRKTVNELAVEDLQSMISNSISEALKPLTEIVKAMQQDISSLKEEKRAWNSDLSAKEDEIQNLREGLDEREQYSRRNNIRVFGIEERRNEDTDQLIVDLAARMNVTLGKCHIGRSHRVGRKGEHARPIIVKFVSYSQRSVVFTSKKSLKGTGITVREDLTKTRLELLKKVVSHNSHKDVWSSDGVILVNVNKARPFRVKSESDLEKLRETSS